MHSGQHRTALIISRKPTTLKGYPAKAANSTLCFLKRWGDANWNFPKSTSETKVETAV
jgi:hypothetical protein